jgi:hypothetical protein
MTSLTDQEFQQQNFSVDYLLAKKYLIKIFKIKFNLILIN